MSAPQNEPPADFDEEFADAIADWRTQHKLAEDDAVLLLIELFRIHQNHWDELRRLEMPAFNQLKSDIALLTQTLKTSQERAALLMDLLNDRAPTIRPATVTRATALSIGFLCLAAGYFIGRAL